MHWQDVMLAASAIMMSFGLISALRSSVAPSAVFSSLFALGSAMIAFVDVALSFWLVAAIMTLQTIAWLILLGRRLKCERLQSVKHGTAEEADKALRERQNVQTRIF